jgi:uncharacterized lipoprotein YddW (UPF0748 family)
MKTMIGLLGVTLTTIAALAETIYPDSKMSGRQTGLPERRLVWTLESGINTNGDWEATAKFLKENGFTDVIARMARGGVAYYNSKIVEASPKVAIEGDLLRKAVAACHKYGIRFHAWKVFWRLNEASVECQKRFIKENRVMFGRYNKPFTGFWQNPEGKRVASDKDDFWMCPADPRNQAEELAVLREMASLGVDGVHLDYIRYNSWYGCYCPRCRDRYEQARGVKVADKDWPAIVDPNNYMDTLWLRQRTEVITDIVKESVRVIKAVNPKCEVSAAVFHGNEQHIYIGQDWPMWCREGLLDFVCPMTYTPNPDQLREQIVPMMPIAADSPKTKIYPSVGVLMSYGKPRLNKEGARYHADIIRWAGFPGICFYMLSSDSAPLMAAAVDVEK